MKKAVYFLGTLLVLVLCSVVLVQYYPYIFAKTVKGVIEGVERIQQPNVVVGSVSGQDSGRGIGDKQFFSFAVAIRDSQSNEIFTASAEDRQWAVAEKGRCAEAKLFPYPPWDFEKGGTYFGARLVRLYECPTTPQ